MNETLAELKIKEKLLFEELKRAVMSGKSYKLDAPFEFPKMPKNATEGEQKRVYGRMIDQYRKALARLV